MGPCESFAGSVRAPRWSGAECRSASAALRVGGSRWLLPPPSSPPHRRVRKTSGFSPPRTRALTCPGTRAAAGAPSNHRAVGGDATAPPSVRAGQRRARTCGTGNLTPSRWSSQVRTTTSVGNIILKYIHIDSNLYISPAVR